LHHKPTQNSSASHTLQLLKFKETLTENYIYIRLHLLQHVFKGQMPLPSPYQQCKVLVKLDLTHSATIGWSGSKCRTSLHGHLQMCPQHHHALLTKAGLCR